MSDDLNDLIEERKKLISRKRLNDFKKLPAKYREEVLDEAHLKKFCENINIFDEEIEALSSKIDSIERQQQQSHLGSAGATYHPNSTMATLTSSGISYGYRGQLSHVYIGAKDLQDIHLSFSYKWGALLYSFSLEKLKLAHIEATLEESIFTETESNKKI